VYNLPIDNHYSKYSFDTLLLYLNDDFDSENIYLASKTAEILKKIMPLFFKGENIHNWYKYRSSYLPNSPFERFSQNVKNKIFKIFIDDLTLKGYVSLRCLELLQEKFFLKYKIIGPTDYKEGYRNKRFLLRLSNSPFEIQFDDIEEYFQHITSEKYQILLQEHVQNFVTEYNQTHNLDNIFNYQDIDILCTYLDLNDNHKVIKFLYLFPEIYDNYINIQILKQNHKFWIDFLLAYKCSNVAKRNQEVINKIIKNIIEEYFIDNEELFHILINKKSTSHMSIYFSKPLKANLRKNMNFSLICYNNCCVKHKKELKRMLGVKITQTSQFKFIFGIKK